MLRKEYNTFDICTFDFVSLKFGVILVRRCSDLILSVIAEPCG